MDVDTVVVTTVIVICTAYDLPFTTSTACVTEAGAALKDEGSEPGQMTSKYAWLSICNSLIHMYCSTALIR